MQAIIPFHSLHVFFFILLLSLHPILIHAFVLTSPTTRCSTHPTRTTTTTLSLPTAPMTSSYPSSSSSPQGQAETTTTTTSPEAEITASPDEQGATLDPDPVDERFRQTTYWSCVQWPGASTAHCGWHEPIIDASMPNAASRGRGGAGRVGMVVGVVASLVVLLVA